MQRLWVIAATGWGVVAMAAAWFGVTAWLGPDFDISGAVAVIMLAGYLVTLWASVLNLWTQVRGAPQLNARGASVGAAVNLALTVALVVPFGILGTVSATATSQVVASILLLRLARRRLSGVTRSFLAEVPVLPSLAAAAVVVGLEFLARPIVPGGAAGLLVCGLVAAPGLVVYALMAFGVRASVQFVRHRLAGLRGQTRAT
jgi:O-antigen/teichoic acid export membrane protein